MCACVCVFFMALQVLFLNMTDEAGEERHRGILKSRPISFSFLISYLLALA